MTAQGKRTTFTHAEKLLLLELIEECKDVMENRRNDNDTTRRKERTWSYITDQFNLRSGEPHERTVMQLQNLLKNTKQAVKRKCEAELGGKGDGTNGDGSPVTCWEVDASNSQLCHSVEMESGGSESDAGHDGIDIVKAIHSAATPQDVKPFPRALSHVVSAARDIRPSPKAAIHIAPAPQDPKPVTSGAIYIVSAPQATQGSTEADRNNPAGIPATVDKRKLGLTMHENKLLELEVLERTARLEHLKRMNELEVQEQELRMRERSVDLERKELKVKARKLDLERKQKMQERIDQMLEYGRIEFDAAVELQNKLHRK